jgi:glyceraldehyde-3-phosphate dehydrogenase (NADP+)
MEDLRLYLGGQWQEGSGIREVRSPYDGRLVGRHHVASRKQVQEAIARATEAFEETRRLPAHERSRICAAVARKISEEADELAALVAQEAGKPITLARGEVGRAVQTFTLAAEEAKRMGGELVDVDAVPAGEGRLGIVRRFPLGPVSAITPFNFPLNLVAHKVAPALAVGNTVVLKPASATPLVALRLAQILDEVGIPKGMFNVVPCPASEAEPLVTDERPRLLTFTGSGEVGWALKSQAGRKRVLLELGGNAAAVVEPDAPLERVAARLAVGAFAYAGQICISVQRIFVHRSVYDAFRELLVRETQALGVGDPMDSRNLVGPMIDEASTERVMAWIQEALERGARCLCGNEREGQVIRPTVLENVDPSLPVSCREVFGPVVVLDAYGDFSEALAKVNDSIYGLQAGIFTQDVRKIWQAFRELEVGGVIHNDYPTFRVDNFPYGGTKQSGLGREGVRYAMEEMTEPRILVLRPDF